MEKLTKAEARKIEAECWDRRPVEWCNGNFDTEYVSPLYPSKNVFQTKQEALRYGPVTAIVATPGGRPAPYRRATAKEIAQGYAEYWDDSMWNRRTTAWDENRHMRIKLCP